MLKIYNNFEDKTFDEWILFLNNNVSLPRYDLPICIGRNYYSEDCVLFNIEQNTRKDLNLTNFVNCQIKEIWDYSLENIRIFNENGIHNVKYVPFKLWDEYKNKILSFNIKKEYEYDVVFVGWKNSRRYKILNELISRGIKLKLIPDDTTNSFLYGDERDKIIANSKILLNIHYDEDYKIFELYRCFPWIGINKTIISENSLDNHPNCINVDYDELVNTVINTLNQ